MSHKKYASPLRIKYSPSRTLMVVMCIIHGGAIAMLVISGISWLAKVVLMLIVSGSLLWFLSVHRQKPLIKAMGKCYPPVQTIVWDNDDRWILMTGEDEELVAQLLTSSFVHPLLTVVNLKLTGKPGCRLRGSRRSFVFMKDNLDAETFRRLRVRLRWYSMPDQDSLGALK